MTRAAGKFGTQRAREINWVMLGNRCLPLSGLEIYKSTNAKAYMLAGTAFILLRAFPCMTSGVLLLLWAFPEYETPLWLLMLIREC